MRMAWAYVEPFSLPSMPIPFSYSLTFSLPLQIPAINRHANGTTNNHFDLEKIDFYLR